MARQTNVLFFVPGFGTGGPERMVEDLAARLDPGRFRSFACSLTSGLVGEAVAARGFPVYTLADAAKGQRPRAIGKLRAFRARVARLEALIERHAIDVLHTHALVPLLHAALARRRARRWRWVHTEQVLPDLPGAYPRWVVPLGRWFLSRADVVAAASDAVGAYVREEAGVAADRVRVIYNCVDVERFGQRHDGAAKRRELSIPADAWVIGVVANLRPQKNHELLLRALARLRPAAPNACLVLVGEGEQRERLETLAGELGIQDRVRFLGPRLDVPELLATFDVYCLPSHYEGLPFSMLEAMAARKPVVATRVLGIREIIRDAETGILVEPDDPDALCGALLRLRQDVALAEKLARAGRHYVETHGRLEQMVDGYAALYTDGRAS